MVNVQQRRRRIGNLHRDNTILRLHRLANRHIVQSNRLALVQLPVVAPAIKGNACNGIAAVGHESLDVDLHIGTKIGYEERKRSARATLRILQWVYTSTILGGIVAVHVNGHHAAQAATYVNCIGRLHV